jgi:hypothetical protein
VGSQLLKLYDTGYQHEINQTKPGETITVELKAALNQDWNKADRGWIDVCPGNMAGQKLEVTETGPDTGIFTAKYLVPRLKKGTELKVSYGYFGLGTEVVAVIN